MVAANPSVPGGSSRVENWPPIIACPNVGSTRLVTEQPDPARQQYVYDLCDAERNELTRDFLCARAVFVRQRFACFQIEGTDRFANIARQVEREVFEDAWGNDSVTMKSEYGPYDDASVFFVVMDTKAKVPAGVLRMIRNSSVGLKTIVDLDDVVKSPIAIPADDVMRQHGIDDLDRCWDGATAAIPRRYRRRLGGVHVQIMRVISAAAIREDIQHFVAVLEAPVFKAARDLLGLPLVPLAGTPPFTHMDAPGNQAVYAHVSSLLVSTLTGNRRVGQKVRDCFAATTFPGLESALER
jgi:hypothetical protein